MGSFDVGSRDRNITLAPTEDALLMGLSEPASEFQHQTKISNNPDDTHEQVDETAETTVLGQSIERGLSVLKSSMF